MGDDRTQQAVPAVPPRIETKEFAGGFAIIEAKSKEEAIEMVGNFLKVAGDGECELRQLMEGTFQHA